MNNGNLAGKVAMVTGGRRGIGKAAAMKLAEAGANVAVCDIVADDGQLDKTAAEVRQFGRQSLALPLDISRPNQVQKVVKQIVDQFGRIDIVVNCAGVWLPGQTLVECSEENWDRVIDTNLKGTFLCCQAAGKIMIRQKSGNIINLSSQVGLNPGTAIGAYSISKAGIIMLTRQLALELSSFHIRVNALAPGVVKTDFNVNVWKDPESEKRLASIIPLGRLAEAEDIAKTVLFLASDESSYITGAVINIDGGWQVPASPVRR